jgi:hypothetical protein
LNFGKIQTQQYRVKINQRTCHEFCYKNSRQYPVLHTPRLPRKSCKIFCRSVCLGLQCNVSRYICSHSTQHSGYTFIQHIHLRLLCGGLDLLVTRQFWPFGQLRIFNNYRLRWPNPNADSLRFFCSWLAWC